MYEIRARVWSDDHLRETDFDATPWFVEDATDEMILDLVDCGWRGDYPADSVALYVGDYNSDVEKVLDYVAVRKLVEDMGFECAVNEEDAIKWMAIHRPHLRTKPIVETNSSDDIDVTELWG